MEDDKEDIFEDKIFMPRSHWFLKLCGIAAALSVLGLVMWGLAEGNRSMNLTYQGNRRATDIRPRSDNPLRESTYRDPASPAGTSGVLTEAPGQEPAAESSPEPVQSLSDVLGTDDPRSLVGRRVELTVPVTQDQTLTAFWVGEPGDRLLVVLGRDTRSGADRQASVPPRHEIMPVRRGQQAIVAGTVERVPDAEHRFNWNLTREQMRELRRRGVYIHADSVRAEGHG
jgi:hypothetical protein